MPAITIDGTEYDTDLMTDKAKAQLASIQFVDLKSEDRNTEKRDCRDDHSPSGL